jgi:rhodanese-related sulfurtransferase
MRPVNQQGPRLRHEIPVPPALSPEEFDRARHAALVVDVRPIDDYTRTHVQGSLSNPFRDSYATWLGWLVPADTPLLFLLGDVPLESVVNESLLVGYENFAGWLEGGIERWVAAHKPVATSELVDAAAARKALQDGAVPLDVREPDEVASGRIEGAVHVSLGDLEANLDKLPKERPIVAYCGGGERSITAVSILQRAGFEAMLNLNGGIDAWTAEGNPVA